MDQYCQIFISFKSLTYFNRILQLGSLAKLAKCRSKYFLIISETNFFIVQLLKLEQFRQRDFTSLSLSCNLCISLLLHNFFYFYPTMHICKSFKANISFAMNLWCMFRMPTLINSWELKIQRKFHTFFKMKCNNYH